MPDLPIEVLISKLESLALPNAEFRHREHLRAAHYYVLRDGYPFALATVRRSIRRFAAHHGTPTLFHVTLTECWVRLVAGALAGEPFECSFAELSARHPDLLEKNAPLRHYSRERLFSERARRTWVEPDLRELPHCPIHRGRANAIVR